MRSISKSLIAAALLLSPFLSELSAQTVKKLTTSDADEIELKLEGGRGNGSVQVCLSTLPGMEFKEVRLTRGVILRSRNGTRDCTAVLATGIPYSLLKQRSDGLFLEVGAGVIDLRGYGNGRAEIRWRKD